MQRYLLGYDVLAGECGGNKQRFYYQQDEQLSTAWITDAEQKVTNLYQYDAFGNVDEEKAGYPNRILYTGQQQDALTGQYYLRARYYHPALGRFLQEDVYQGDGLNLYAYCGNNPVTYYDPSGYGKNDCPPGSMKETGDKTGGSGETTRVRHYTNRKGSKGIEDTGEIIAQDNNRVYVELANKKPLNQLKAESKYQLGKGKGRDYVEFDVYSKNLEWVKNPRYHTEELTIKGNVKVKDAEYVRRK